MRIFKLLPSLTAMFFSALLCGQISFQESQHSFTLSTRNMEPKQIQAIDGVSTVHYARTPANVQGSRFLNKEFIQGTMTIVDGTEIPGLGYRYDIYGDEMQFLLNGDTASITKPLSLRSLQVGEKKFVYDVFQVSENSVAAGYFEVIEEGDILTILYRREIELEQDAYVTNYGGGGGTKEFKMVEKNSYYLKQDRKTAQKIFKKKDFLNTISDHQAEVKQYMKDHRISVRKQKDLQAVVNYYNSLTETGS